MVRYALPVIAASLLIFTAVASAITQSTWRPFSNPSALITLGMSKGEVLLKAGAPDLAETLSYGVAGSLSRIAWTYVRTGYNAAVVTLTFKGNNLVRIEVMLSKS